MHRIDDVRPQRRCSVNDWDSDEPATESEKNGGDSGQGAESEKDEGVVKHLMNGSDFSVGAHSKVRHAPL